MAELRPGLNLEEKQPAALYKQFDPEKGAIGLETFRQSNTSLGT